MPFDGIYRMSISTSPRREMTETRQELHDRLRDGGGADEAAAYRRELTETRDALYYDAEQGALERPNATSLTAHVSLSEQGVQILGDIDITEYVEAVSNITKLTNACSFALGDLIAYGEDHPDWGEMYTQALDETDLSYSTLAHSACVSPVPTSPADRVEGLSWSHHREALAIKDPTERLDALASAKLTGISALGLREEIVSARDPRSRSATHVCPKCQHEF
jgi:hypothetical protein